MYLKSVEIHGFKSFANRMILEFPEGITGIVGPNGSGKSNVADAVRWVLGEQSAKQLRGANMQDVIFSGTETRKSMGFAYVAMTLDNKDHALKTDYEEVVISRRVYRNGDSEYRLNGTSVRLKDIRELFYDTGVGKEGYSIIGQGQIDRILSSRPEDRRELFDEAAGIVAYKRRKEEALKNLKEEQEHLVRLQDIYGELSRQLLPLEKQSEDARTYLKIREEEKDLDLKLYLRRSDRLQEEEAGLRAEKQTAEEEAKQARSAYEKLTADYEAEVKKREERDRLLEESEAKRREEGILLEQEKGRAELCRSGIRHEIEQRKRLKSRREEIQVEEKKLRKEEASLKKQTDALLKKIEEKREEAREKRLLFDTLEEDLQKLRKEAEARKESMILALDRKGNEGQKQSRIEAMKEQTELQISRVIADRIGLEDLCEEHRRLLKEGEDRRLFVEKSYEAKDKALRTEEASYRELQEKNRETARKIARLREDYHRVHSRLEAVRNLAERYEGYGLSIRKVMEAKGRIGGIEGVVADLFEVSPEHETAIETALGGALQNIVTSSERDAKAYIEYLKKNKLGRATFLPLDSIQPRSLRDRSILSEEAVLGTASDLVRCKESYRAVRENLLGQVVVVTNLTEALRLAKKYRYSYRLVTLEGDLLFPGGSLSGGSYKNSSNLLGRKRELEETGEEEKRLHKEYEEALKSEEEGKKQEAEKEKKIRDAKEELQKSELELTRLRSEEEAGRRNLSQSLKQREESEKEERLLREQLSEIELSLASLKDRMDSIQKEGESEEAEIHRLRREEARREGSRILFRKQAEEAEKALREAEDERMRFEFEGRQTEENLQRLLREAERFDEEEADSLRKEEELKNSLTEVETRIQEREAAAKEEEEAVRTLRILKEEEREKEKGILRERDLARDRKETFERRLEKLLTREDAIEEELNRMSTFLWEEYEATGSDAEEKRSDDLPAEKVLRSGVEELRKRRKALGNVNLSAIDDYREVKERCDELSVQLNDLTESEATLQNVIIDLSKGMKEQFVREFERIQKAFRSVFRTLFGGGEASLSLKEDEDPTAAGIEIIAQPPGKKLQNMMQLSGGEKALTAISLLFAIQSLKPSPFCLLDEIEAALDDSNVLRFAEYLRKLTKNTQFIVITHRRGTMQAADRLYGITMQEKGVSILVEVNLIEDELTE